MSSRPLLRGLAILAAVGWTAFLLLLLFMPVGSGPSMPYMDKVVHFVLFFGFAVLWPWGGVPHRAVLIAGIALAPLTEVVQGLLPWPRGTELADVVADILGVLAGIWMAGVPARLGWVRASESIPPDSK